MNFFDEILESVPDFKEFYTLEEINKHTMKLRKQYPDIVSVEEIGKSKNGREIYCLKIGDGNKIGLLYGASHPNEPIGTMMLDTFCEILASNENFRKEMNYTWYIVKVTDVDGLCFNEGWFKSKHTISDYQHHFFRPAFEQQVEWSFPIDYKKYHFSKPTPETIALMKLIKNINPDFVYSLHNSGFGGCYWYISDGNLDLFKKLKKIPQKYKIPLHLGRPELPYCKQFSDAIFKMSGLSDNYDYLETYIPNTPTEQMISGGGCCFDYVRKVNSKKTHFIVAEVPYYTNLNTSNTNLTEKLYLDELLKGSKKVLEDYQFCNDLCRELQSYMKVENKFYYAAYEQSSVKNRVEAMRKHAIDTIDPLKKATVAQLFDLRCTNRFYSNLCIVLLRRACDYELNSNQNTKASINILTKARAKLYDRECENIKYMEEKIKYDILPIRDLIKIQLESGLLYAKYIQEGKI